jgi:TolA-binding protein
MTLALLLTALAPHATGATPDTPRNAVDLAVQLERENAALRQLRERLKAAESQFGALPAAPRATPQQEQLDAAPSSVVTDILEVERSAAEGRILYRVAARDATALQLFQAIAQTSGLTLEIHPDTGRAAMLARLRMDLRSADLPETLDILAGCQGLAVTLDAQAIRVGPLASGTGLPIHRRLRELSVESYQAALLKYPDHASAPAAYMGVARHYAAEGYHDAAVQTLQRIVERYTASDTAGPALMLMGDCQQALGHYAAARGTYYRHVDLHPGAPDMPLALLKIAEMWGREDKWTQAVPVLESVVRQHPDSAQTPLARMRLAECMMRAGDYDRAIDQLQSVAASARRGALGDELRLLLAECYLRIRRPVAARVAYRDLALSATDTLIAERAYYALGDSFLSEGKLVDAVETYRGAVRRFPEGPLRPVAPLALARAFLAMGLLRDADRELRRCADATLARPEARPVILAVLRGAIETRDSARALELLYDPRWPHDTSTDPELLVVEGRALLLAGSPDAAIERGGTAARLAKDDATRAEACRVAGEAYALRKDVARAAMAYAGRVE